MKNLPEELVYGLVIAAMLLFQYLVKRFGPDPQPEQAIPHADPDLEAAEQTSLDQTPFPVPAEPAVRPDRIQTPGAHEARAWRRFSRRSLMGNRRDLHDGIVIATILGPCRAFEPHDIK